MRRAVVVLGIVILLVASFLVRFEVDPIDSDANAVATAHPVLTSTVDDRGMSGQGTILEPTVPATWEVATAALQVTPTKYVAPAPVTKTIWDALLKPATLLPAPLPGGDTGSGTLKTCAQTSKVEILQQAKSYATITIAEPTGSVSEYRTDPVSYTVSKTTIRYSCSDGTQKASWAFASAPISCDVGVYYFTKGFGDYTFHVTIFRVDGAGQPDVEVGSLNLVVPVTPEGLGD